MPLVVLVAQHLGLLLRELRVAALEEAVVAFAPAELPDGHEDDEAHGQHHHDADHHDAVHHAVVRRRLPGRK